MERLNPLSDIVFNNIFMDMSAAPAMLGFINAVMRAAGDAAIDRIVRLESQYALMAEQIGKKSGRVDVYAESDDNQCFDVEVQLRGGFDINERDVFYAGKLIGGGMPAGETYDRLPRVRIINILDYVIRQDQGDYLQPVGLIYRLPNTEGGMTDATNALRIYHIQLPLFRKRFETLQSTRGDALATWLYAFDRGYKSREEMEVLSSMTEGLGTFARRYNRATDDPHLRALYEYELSARMDDASRIASAMKEGEARGEARGEAKGRTSHARETALRLRDDFGIHDPEQVAKMVGESVDAVRRWFNGQPGEPAD